MWRKTETFTHRSPHKQKLLHRETFGYIAWKHRAVTQEHLHRATSTPRSIYTEQPLHTERFAQKKLLHRSFLTPLPRRSLDREELLHTGVFPQKSLYIQQLLHAEAFTQRSLSKEEHLHAEASTHKVLRKGACIHRNFYAESFTGRRLALHKV